MPFPVPPKQIDQDFALEVLLTGRNAFITGAPGTGKSYLLRKFVREARKTKRVAITASTGIAGTHIGGITLHSWAGLGVREEFGKKEIDYIAKNKMTVNRIERCDVLIIDEVSMINSKTFHAADLVCQKIRRRKEPFGGLQIILSGDFFQLPPVNRSGAVEFVYGSESWGNLNPAILYLTKQFRQKDESLTGILSAIRDMEISKHHFDLLMSRMNANFDVDVTPTRLHTHNLNVDNINSRELSKIKNNVKSFEMTSSGVKHVAESLRKSCMAPEMLELKVGAAVMFVKNNLSDGYVNGTLGTVADFDDSKPVVVKEDGISIVVEPQTWIAEDFDGSKVAEVTQTPLRLAWAISVHKSQGMSLSFAEIDLSKAFVEGLGYVALSRVTTLEGIRLLGLNRRALMTSETAAEIDSELRHKSANFTDSDGVSIVPERVEVNTLFGAE